MTRDPWQVAADEAAGVEGALIKHNCKTGVVIVDGARIAPDMTVSFLMSTATHGWLRFEGNKPVERDIRRYADVAPSRDEPRAGWDPNMGRHFEMPQKVRTP